MSNVIELLEGLKIHIVVARQRFLRIGWTKPILIDIRKKGAPQFNLILCSATKTPVFKIPIDVEKQFIENFFDLDPEPKQHN